MTEKIIIAGAGGQGIMLLGKVFAVAALREGLNITWFPTYGAEVRGGAAHCMVIISSFEIPFPYIEKADTIIIMNEPSLLKFKQRVKDKGLLLINSSLVNPVRSNPAGWHASSLVRTSNGVNPVKLKDVTGSHRKGSRGIDDNTAKHKTANSTQIYLPFTEVAEKLGDVRVANTVALGAYVAKKGIFSKQIVFSAIEEIAPAEKRGLIAINKQAIEEGIKLVK